MFLKAVGPLPTWGVRVAGPTQNFRKTGPPAPRPTSGGQDLPKSLVGTTPDKPRAQPPGRSGPAVGMGHHIRSYDDLPAMRVDMHWGGGCGKTTPADRPGPTLAKVAEEGDRGQHLDAVAPRVHNQEEVNCFRSPPLWWPFAEALKGPKFVNFICQAFRQLKQTKTPVAARMN